MHGGVHTWVGGYWQLDSGNFAIGDMGDVATSPNDPLFFSHHANLDRIYYLWRLKTGDKLATVEDPCGLYYGPRASFPQVNTLIPLEIYEQ